MKKIFSLFAAVLFAGSMIAADPVVLTFSDWGDTSLNKDNKPANTVGDFGTAYTTTSLIDSLQGAAGFVTCTGATQAYAARVGYGCKMGSGKATGSFTLNLVTPAEFDSIVVNCSSYSAKEGSLSINGGDAIDLTDGGVSNKVLRNVTYVPTGEVSSLTIETTALRAYVKSITFFPKEGEGLEGWNNTAVFSKTQIASIADLEGITLTLAGASLELLDESDFGGIYLQDEQGSDIYAICHPSLGGNFAINGDVVTLTGWSTTDDYCVNLPSESATLYFSDYGCFSIDGEPEYFSEDDIAISYIAAEATTYTVNFSVVGHVEDETFATGFWVSPDYEKTGMFVAGNNTVEEGNFVQVLVQYIEGYSAEVKVNNEVVTLEPMGLNLGWRDSITADMTIVVTFTAPQGEKSEYASIYTSNVDFTAGTNSYLSDKINIDGEEYDAFKIGTSKAAGSCSVTLPAGTEAFHFHAICWSKTADTELFITGAYEETVVIKAANISGNSPYTFDLTYADPTNRFYSHTFDAPLTEEATVTFNCNYRAVFFGVNVEGNFTPTALENVKAVKAVKALENGKVVILRNGVRYNVVGMQF